MTDIEKMVEKRANDLKDKFTNHPFGEPDWEKVGRYVLILEIEARIDQTNKIYGVCDKSRPTSPKDGRTTIVVLQTVQDYARISDELQAQLTALKGQL